MRSRDTIPRHFPCGFARCFARYFASLAAFTSASFVTAPT